MRRPLLFLLLSLSPAGGCCSPGLRTGWRFEVLRPPTVATESIVQSGPAPLGVVGLAGGGLRAEGNGFNSVGSFQAAPTVDRGYEHSLVIFANLQQINERIAALERALQPRMPAPDPQPQCEGGRRW